MPLGRLPTRSNPALSETHPLSRYITAADRYIFRLVVVPMIGVFVLAASLLLLEKMLRLFEFVSTEGGPVTVVFRMLLNVVPEYAGLAIPLGLMLGILFAFRKLAISSELDVMRAVGWSYTRLLRVPYLITLVLLALNFAIVGYIQPQSRFAYEEMEFELRSGALGAAIKVGEFNTIDNRVALRIEGSQDEGRQLMGIFARVADSEGQVLSISASEGRFLANREDRNTIILRLVDGTIVHDVKNGSPRVLSFSQHDLPIDLPAIQAFRDRGGDDEREYILPELLEIGWSEDFHRAGAAKQPRQFQLPDGGSGDDADAAAACGGAGDPAQALNLGAGSVYFHRDRGRISQGQSIRCGTGRYWPGRSISGAVGAVRGAFSDDQLDVLSGRFCAGRAGHRLP